MSWSSPYSPLLFSHRDDPHVAMMPMFVKWEDKQGQQAAEEEPVEGTEAVVEGEDAGEIGTATGEVGATAEEKSNPPPKKPKRSRRKAETPEG